ncbi:MAG: glycosyltransferase [Herpetosiphon sp.]
MRILQVTPYYYPELKFGGPPQKIHALSRHLADRGHDVRVVTFHSERPRGYHAAVEGVDVRYLWWVGKGAWPLPLDLAKLSAAVQQADVVHCYGLYNFLCPTVALMARVHHRPYLLEPLGMYVPRARNTGAKLVYHRLFTGWMARRATAVVATSPQEVGELAGLTISHRLVLRRNGTDLDAFKKLPEPTMFRTQYQIDPHERIILFIGRISPIKNLEQLVQAFASVSIDRARLVLMGPMLEPGYATRLRTLITTLGLHNRIHIIGPLYNAEKLAVLAAADLFVLPSLYESYGNAAAEAVAAGVPVLLTEGCGLAPVIHGRAGMAVHANVTALAEGLRAMLDEPQRTAFTRRRTEVLSELSWEQPISQMELLYQQIIMHAPFETGTAERNAEVQLDR